MNETQPAVCVQDMGLHGFAEKFVQAGMAVFVFDYRFFGGSSGHPRHKLR